MPQKATEPTVVETLRAVAEDVAELHNEAFSLFYTLKTTKGMGDLDLSPLFWKQLEDVMDRLCE